MATPKKNKPVEQKTQDGEDAKKLITKEILMQIQLNHKDLKIAEMKLEAIRYKINDIDKAKALVLLEQSDAKNRISMVKRNHEIYLDGIRAKTGVDIRNKVINFETYEVTDA